MKELIFLRHAKSDWGNEQLRDIDRHLAERGNEDAYRLGAWFAQSRPKPQLVISSTATRALSTAMVFLREMELDHRSLQLEEKLYEASTDQIKSVIAAVDNSIDRILLVGHNPGFTDTINQLGDDLYLDNLPTCGLFAFKCKCNKWSEVVQGGWPVDFYQFPKEFKNN